MAGGTILAAVGLSKLMTDVQGKLSLPKSSTAIHVRVIVPTYNGSQLLALFYLL